MKAAFRVVLAGLLVLAYPAKCYFGARLAIAECDLSCEAEGLHMSSYISGNPIDAFAGGKCIGLSGSPATGAAQD